VEVQLADIYWPVEHVPQDCGWADPPVQKKPVGHGIGLSVIGEKYWPGVAAVATQLLDPSPEVVPPAHVAHTDAPEFAAKVPAAHAVQTVLLPRPYVPSAQVVQALPDQ
jgi:hypothetical protein